MPTPRAYHALLEVENGDILVIGGPSDAPISRVDRFEFESMTWTSGPPLPAAITHPAAQVNGDLRMVVGTGPDDARHAFGWVAGAWQVLAPPPVVPVAELWPWGTGMILAGWGYGRGMIYDAAADEWTSAPRNAGSGPGWETGLSSYVNPSTLLFDDELFIVAATGGSHPDIGQQNVAARLVFGSDAWSGGAVGPFWGDTASGFARRFAPGRVLVVHSGFENRADVYDAEDYQWCRTAEAPVDSRTGNVVVLDDSSVLFTGSRAGEPALLWRAG